MQSIEGKVAMITGAGGSVGSYLTETFLELGCKTVLLYRNPAHKEGLSEFRNRFGDSVSLIQTELSVPEEAHRAVSDAMETSNRIDFLVNPVGGWLGGMRLHEHTFDDLQAMLGMDVFPSFNLFREVLPVMQRQGGGKIINFASMAALGSEPDNAVYAASKSAIISMTSAIAKEYGKDGIRSYAIAPSTIDTESNRKAMPNANHEAWVSLEEIAETVVFLCASGNSISSTVLKFTGELR